MNGTHTQNGTLASPLPHPHISQFVGKWRLDLERSESMDAFFEAVGIPWVARKVMQKLVPTQAIEFNAEGDDDHKNLMTVTNTSSASNKAMAMKHYVNEGPQSVLSPGNQVPSLDEATFDASREFPLVFRTELPGGRKGQTIDQRKVVRESPTSVVMMQSLQYDYPFDPKEGKSPKRSIVVKRVWNRLSGDDMVVTNTTTPTPTTPPPQTIAPSKVEVAPTTNDEARREKQMEWIVIATAIMGIVWGFRDSENSGTDWLLVILAAVCLAGARSGMARSVMMGVRDKMSESSSSFASQTKSAREDAAMGWVLSATFATMAAGCASRLDAVVWFGLAIASRLVLVEQRLGDGAVPSLMDRSTSRLPWILVWVSFVFLTRVFYTDRSTTHDEGGGMRDLSGIAVETAIGAGAWTGFRFLAYAFGGSSRASTMTPEYAWIGLSALGACIVAVVGVAESMSDDDVVDVSMGWDALAASLCVVAYLVCRGMVSSRSSSRDDAKTRVTLEGKTDAKSMARARMLKYRMTITSSRLGEETHEYEVVVYAEEKNGKGDTVKAPVHTAWMRYRDLRATAEVMRLVYEHHAFGDIPYHFPPKRWTKRFYAVDLVEERAEAMRLFFEGTTRDHPAEMMQEVLMRRIPGLREAVIAHSSPSLDLTSVTRRTEALLTALRRALVRCETVLAETEGSGWTKVSTGGVFPTSGRRTKCYVKAPNMRKTLKLVSENSEQALMGVRRSVSSGVDEEEGYYERFYVPRYMMRAMLPLGWRVGDDGVVKVSRGDGVIKAVLRDKRRKGRYALIVIQPDGFIDGTFVEPVPTREEEESLVSRYEGR